MAAAVQKITLASSRDIPFNKLALSQANVRRVKAGISVEELAESIARRGLIQSLHVCPVVDAEGKETGLFEVGTDECDQLLLVIDDQQTCTLHDVLPAVRDPARCPPHTGR